MKTVLSPHKREYNTVFCLQQVGIVNKDFVNLSKNKQRKEELMTIEIALLISFVSVSAAVCFGVVNYKRNKSKDDKEDAGQQATIITKLDGIERGVDDIKDELKNLKNEVKEDHDRIIRLEESSKQAHRRLDSLGRKEV